MCLLRSTVRIYYRYNCYSSGLHMQTDAACALTRRQHFPAWNDVMATILKVWRQVENPTSLIDAYLLEEHSCQIKYWSDLKQRSLSLFEDKMSFCMHFLIQIIIRRRPRIRLHWLPLYNKLQPTYNEPSATSSLFRCWFLKSYHLAYLHLRSFVVMNKDVYNIGSGSWLVWANGIAARYAANQCQL